MRKKLIIVGGGSCALMLAASIDESLFDVSIYERNAAPGRKFLVAGDGGLNLTHSEPAKDFIKRYSPPAFLQRSFESFNNTHLMDWFRAAGIPLFTGSSGRVFPEKGIRPIEVLNVFLEMIRKKNIRILSRHIWKGFAEDPYTLIFDAGNDHVHVKADIIVFCLGGASWPVTGSSGDWLAFFSEKNITTAAFEASNCAFLIRWPPALVSRIAGKALKNISLSCGDQTRQGEIVITEQGIEGSGVYPLSPAIRAELREEGAAILTLDLKPSLSPEAVRKKLSSIPSGVNYTEAVGKILNLGRTQMSLLKFILSKEEFLNIPALVQGIKSLPLRIYAAGPLQEAISTVGGITLSEITEDFELKKMPGHYAIGEMLDYDAPTGGYLLQSCFTMSMHLAKHLQKISEDAPGT